VFRPVAGDATTIPFSAVFLPNNDNPAFRRFRSLARAMAKKWEERSIEGAAHQGAERKNGKRMRTSPRPRGVRST